MHKTLKITGTPKISKPHKCFLAKPLRYTYSTWIQRLERRMVKTTSTTSGSRPLQRGGKFLTKFQKFPPKFCGGYFTLRNEGGAKISLSKNYSTQFFSQLPVFTRFYSNLGLLLQPTIIFSSPKWGQTVLPKRMGAMAGESSWIRH